MNLLNSKPPGKHIHNSGYLVYQEILKLIPQDWQNEIEQNTALPQKDTIKAMFFSSRRKQQKENIAEKKMQATLPYFILKKLTQK